MLDKISILEIKSERITDTDALANVRHELALLTSARDQSIPSDVDISAEFSELTEINKALWDIEDDIRDCERRGDFGSYFMELARAVYGTNDKRSAVKRLINKSLGSALIEEKSYTTYSGVLDPCALNTPDLEGIFSSTCVLAYAGGYIFVLRVNNVSLEIAA